MTVRFEYHRAFGTPGLLNADFARVGGQAVEGIIVSAGPAFVAEQLPDDPFAKRQTLAFRTLSKSEFYVAHRWLFALTHLMFGCFFDGAKRAMSKVKPDTTEFRATLRNAIFETTDLKGALSIYNFKPGRAYGADERGFVLVKSENGAWKYVIADLPL